MVKYRALQEQLNSIYVIDVSVRCFSIRVSITKCQLIVARRRLFLHT